MRIVVPSVNGELAMHFGHCEAFAVFDVDPETKTITGEDKITSPGHEPGFLPRWLAEQGAEIIIAGGMGNRARMLFEENNIEVMTGAPAEAPKAVVQAWLDGSLACGGNPCDH
jgi:predicted Fe-Mo cluster-binding NifX family protein